MNALTPVRVLLLLLVFAAASVQVLRADLTGHPSAGKTPVEVRVQVVLIDLENIFPDEARISPEGEVVTAQRVWGNFSQPLVLHDFPFDQQEMRINPKNANPRISVSVTAMLTLIAYRFAVSASLPKIGYLTRDPSAQDTEVIQDVLLDHGVMGDLLDG